MQITDKPPTTLYQQGRLRQPQLSGH